MTENRPELSHYMCSQSTAINSLLRFDNPFFKNRNTSNVKKIHFIRTQNMNQVLSQYESISLSLCNHHVHERYNSMLGIPK